MVNSLMDGTLGGDSIDGNAQVVGQKANNAENDQSGVEGRQDVAGSDEEGVFEAVVVELVVTGQSDETAPARGQREEYLHGRVAPHRSLQQQLPPGRQVIQNAVRESGQRCRFDEQDRQNDVREQRREPHRL